MMEPPLITCQLVDDQDLDHRYLSGRLDQAEAEAFEAHFFGCDRCWNLVKGGIGVRSANAESAVRSFRFSRRWWAPLAMAAGLGVIILGTWRVVRGPDWATGDTIRGTRDSLALHSEMSNGRWTAVWPSVPGASSYRLRVFTADGSLVLTRESGDTLVRLPADSLTAPGGGEPLFLEVEGFDLLRRPLARSPLMPLSSPIRPD